MHAEQNSNVDYFFDLISQLFSLIFLSIEKLFIRHNDRVIAYRISIVVSELENVSIKILRSVFYISTSSML